VDIGGKGVFQSESVSGLIGEIRENMRAIEESGKFEGIEEKKQVLSLYQEAIKKLLQRKQDSHQQK